MIRDEWREYAEQVVADAPPLTPWQVTRLRAILAPRPVICAPAPVRAVERAA